MSTNFIQGDNIMDNVEILVAQLLDDSNKLISNNDLSIYGIKELRDGLTIENIKRDYPWILKAKIERAMIGKRGNHLAWYDGTWNNGTWEYGAWYKGIWYNGIWQKGAWISGTWEDGTWKGGRWCNGIWRDGTWLDGKWKDGIWLDGIWLGGYDADGNYYEESPDEWLTLSMNKREERLVDY